MDLKLNITAPTVTVGAISGTINGCQGTASGTEQQFNVSGTALNGPINISAPANFEVSTSATSGFASSVSLTPVSNTVNSTIIYIRSAASAPSGSISGTVTVASSGTTTQNVSVSGMINFTPTISIGSVNNVSSNAASFSLPFSGATSSPDAYNIGNGSPNVMPNFNSTNGSLTSSPIVIKMPTPAPPAATYNMFVFVRNTSTGCFSPTYPFTVTVLSANADLSSLTTSAGAVSPAFAAATTSYSLSVPNATSSITVTPTVADASANVKVNGTAVTTGNSSAAINLTAGGSTAISVVVTAQDNSTKTYTLTVTRAAGNPIFSSFSPTSAKSGDVVTITGTNLSAVTSVTFGGVAATSFNVVSSTQITAVVPHANSGNVVITDPSGSYTLSGFTYLSTLPVTFVSVKAVKENSHVKISWQVADPTDSRQFVIQRSSNGRDFSNVGSIDASRQTQYNYIDLAPLPATGYYRIKSLGVSGQELYSDIVTVSNGNTNTAIAIYPNPVNGNKFNVHISNTSQGIYHISVINAVGKQIFAGVISGTGTDTNYSVKLPVTLAQGMYHVKVTLPDNSIQTKQIIITSAP